MHIQEQIELSKNDQIRYKMECFSESTNIKIKKFWRGLESALIKKT